MPKESNRLKLPLPLGNETVNRESINSIFEKIDAGVATQADLDAIREAVSKMDIPDASLTQKGKVQLSNATESTSQILAATSKAVNDARQAAENNAKGASLPRAGGALTGRVDFQTWGSFSADAGGSVLYGSNCYLDPSGSPRTFRYTNTHANLGARGIYMQYTGSPTSAVEIYEFDTGAVASTAGAAFTPVLKRLANTDDFMQPNDNPSSNMIWNSTGLFGLDGWTNVGSVPFLTTTSTEVTGFFYVNDAVPSGQYAVLDSAAATVYSGTQYDLQAMFYSVGSNPDTIVYIEVKNAASDNTLFSLGADSQKWWHRKKLTFTIPAGVSQIKLRLVVTNAPAGVTKGVARIRLNPRNVTNKDVPYDFTGDMSHVANQLQAVKQSGVDAKQGITNAINAKGGSASINDTWTTLASKISAIQQGNYQNIEVPTVFSYPNIPPGHVGMIGSPFFATIPAGARIIIVKHDDLDTNTIYTRNVYSDVFTAFALRDANGVLWRITELTGTQAAGGTILRTYSSIVDMTQGKSYSTGWNSNTESVRVTSVTQPSGFNPNAGPMTIVHACFQNYSTVTKEVDCKFGGRIISM